MRKIFKYNLNEFVEMPKGARVLSAGLQPKTEPTGANLRIWALVDPEEEEMEIRHFHLIPTGNAINDELLSSLRYINTFFIDWTVWHFFEQMPEVLLK
jgi:hypothetical protein